MVCFALCEVTAIRPGEYGGNEIRSRLGSARRAPSERRSRRGGIPPGAPAARRALCRPRRATAAAAPPLRAGTEQPNISGIPKRARQDSSGSACFSTQSPLQSAEGLELKADFKRHFNFRILESPGAKLTEVC